MNDQEYHAKLTELDHLFNDDDADGFGESGRIWDLLAEVSHHDLHENIRA